MRNVPILYDEDITRLVAPRDAADALRDRLLAGFDPSSDPSRSIVDVRSGQLLLMPSESSGAVGVKAATVAPGNPSRGLPRVHGAYLLFDADTLELRAIMDGATISSLRTPAVSMAGAAPAFARFDRPVRVTIFGAGPQAVNHADAIRRGGFARVEDIVYVVRDAERARAALGPDAAVLGSADPALSDRLRASDAIVCTTTASTPVFDSSLLADRAVVMVVGAHEAHRREVDGDLMARATVVVEDRETALREAGDVVLAIGEGLLAPDALISMAEVIRGTRRIDQGRPYVFKSVGMSWEDLAVAEVVLRRHEAALEPSAR